MFIALVPGRAAKNSETIVKILLVAYYFPPIISGGSQRPTQMFKYLTKLGDRVTVLAPTYDKANPPEQSVIHIYDPSHNMHRKGMRRLQWLFHRIPIEINNYLGKYSSIYSQWQQNVLNHADEILQHAQPELIIATYPPVETLQIGLMLSQKAQVPLVADFRDGLLFETIESKRLRRFACVYKAYQAIEKRIANEAAALITVSEPLSKYFRETYNNSCVRTIANGFDPDEMQLQLPDIDLAPEYFHIVHSGRFSLSDASCTILPLVHALNSLLADRPELAQKLQLHFLGELSRQEIKILAGLVQYGVAHLHGPLNRKYSLAFQRRADLLLLVTSPSRRSVATAKIFEYLQARRPILALTPHSFAAEIIEKCRCGWVVSPLAVNEIRLILERIIDDPIFYQDINLSASVIADYSITVSLDKLSKLLRTLDKNHTA
jgi:glycosyltransferase involved in cell wall biosynthesis